MTAPDRGDEVTRDAAALSTEIARIGVACSVETRDGLAVLLPVTSNPEAFQSAETRRAVIALARQHGFTHVAVELPNDHGGAGRDTNAPLLCD